ncbi:siderophore-interacting protein [Actinoplanes solisilvae]|uniref:siderophore-interacting protein n=1 Tax=Actinoplanes solisilvae TaxID=2486853 RepID=UPI000FD90B91|nr:siderophore-interacting protein [Actinoplanes solisilvae]
MEAARRLAGACATCDLPAVEALLAHDVVALCDSGGLVESVHEPVEGVADVAVFTLSVLGGRPGTAVTVENVNGQPGIAVRLIDGRAVAVVALACVDGLITGLYIVLSPLKLRGWHRP